MEQRVSIHIIGGNSRSRAEQARLILEMGHHAEVYSDLVELIDRPPQSGVIIASEDVLKDGISAFLDELTDAGVWTPLVAAKPDPDVDEVVQAIQAGALDFLQLPLTEENLRRIIAHVHSDAGSHAEARRRLIDARCRIGTLSKREREVLNWLAEGCSNKVIARILEISPRTVEVHRANMMDKLGANHAAEAVRLRIEAGFQDDERELPAKRPDAHRAGGLSHRPCRARAHLGNPENLPLSPQRQ